MNFKSKKITSLILVVLMLSTICFSGQIPFVSATTASTTSTNLALGKSVAFSYGSSVTDDANWGITAINKGTAVLTDGVNDSVNYWVNNGNPYIGIRPGYTTGPYSFTVNLGEMVIVKSISAYFTDRYQAEAPVSVSYSVSSDGSTWKEMGTVETVKSSYTTLTATDGSVRIYKFNLNIEDTDAMFVKVSFENASTTTDVGIGEIEVYGEKYPEPISVGKDVSFEYGSSINDDANWGVKAINEGKSVLTDGVSNSINYWVNNGNPYVGIRPGYTTGPYSFSMYMSGLATVKNISTYFTDRYQAEAPEAVDYYISGDGSDWKHMGTVDVSQASYTTLTSGNETIKIYRFSLDVSETDVMFVKAVFNNNSDTTDIGFGEFEVYGSNLNKTIVNLAKGLMSNTNNYTYEITGGGSTTHPSNSSYTVSSYENRYLKYLTDEASGTYVPIYRNDTRILTLDLGGQKNITSLWMRFAKYEAGGIYLPSKVQYYASENGTDYYLVKEIANDETTYYSKSGNYTLHYFKTNTVCVNARYVKIVFPTSVFVNPDELYIYGFSSTSAQAYDLETAEKYDPDKGCLNAFPDTAVTGGVMNEYLAYSGWSYGSDGSKLTTQKTQKEYLAAIAYVDSNGVAQDWLYDSVTVMGHHNTSSGGYNSYVSTATSGSSYADKDDWYEWLCYAFGETTSGEAITSNGEQINLPALEAAVATAKSTLGESNYKVSVKLCVYPAVHFQDNWGTIDGKNLDFTISGAGSKAAAIANRKAAYQWYIDTALAMWEEAGFEHLELTGFYYYEECIREAADPAAKGAIQALTEIVHNAPTPSGNTKEAFDSRQGGRLYIYQIPFYQAEGYYNWAEYGFDYAIMQPNLSFTSEADGLAQLKTCAESCKKYGLGFEMEFGGVSTSYISKFRYYLDYGNEYGYVNTVLGWYMGTWGLYQTSVNSSNTRYIYDDVYEFVKANKSALAVSGDANIDNILSIRDATEIQMYLTKRTEFTDTQVELADITNDGNVSINDVTGIQKQLAKIY